MIVMKYGPFRVGEVFFSQGSINKECDLLRCRQFSHTEGMEDVEQQATLLLDLTLDAEVIFRNIKKSTQYEIRRAENKDEIGCRVLYGEYLSTGLIDKLQREYNLFSSNRGIAPLNRQRLERLRESGLLYVSQACSARGDDLAYHAYIVTQQRARLLYSISIRHGFDEAMVGRANRLLHWRDIVFFREIGVAVYDFGGWYQGLSDKVLLGINRFKRDFGGQLSLGYNGLKWFGWRGYIAFLLWRLKKVFVS